MAGIEFQGEEIVYLVEVPDSPGPGETSHRPFNQTDGSTTIEADAIELDTKDKTGSDYGKVTQSISFEGILTEDDPVIDYLKKAIRGKQFVTIIEVNTRTLEAEKGRYMITSFERGYSNGDFATYSVDADLNGVVSAQTLEEIPDGAQ